MNYTHDTLTVLCYAMGCDVMLCYGSRVDWRIRSHFLCKLFFPFLTEQVFRRFFFLSPQFNLFVSNKEFRWLVFFAPLFIWIQKDSDGQTKRASVAYFYLTMCSTSISIKLKMSFPADSKCSTWCHLLLWWLLLLVLLYKSTFDCCLYRKINGQLYGIKKGSLFEMEPCT